jgi:serine phosphatase RsbU (regulator of sigma subunit)
MDLSLVKINAGTGACTYAGANNALYHFRNGELVEYKPDKQPVGYIPDMKPFTRKDFNVGKGDYLVLFTDGYADQFGGDKGKKFMYKSFKEILKRAIAQPSQEATSILDNEFRNWRGRLEQIDDVCVIGIKL